MKSGCSSLRELVLEFALLAALAESPGVERPECVVEDGAVEGVDVPGGRGSEELDGELLMSERLYFDQSASTSGRDSPGRFSRLAASVSKQKAQ